MPGYAFAYPPNLTSDPEIGLADRSAEDILRAFRQGKRPGGSTLRPLMPWRGYAHLTDKDVRALAAYIKSLPPIEHPTPERIDDPSEAERPFLTIQAPD